MAEEHAHALEDTESSLTDRLTASHSDAIGSLRESLSAEHSSAQDAARFPRALDALENAWEIGDAELSRTPIVLERITA